MFLPALLQGSGESVLLSVSLVLRAVDALELNSSMDLTVVFQLFFFVCGHTQLLSCSSTSQSRNLKFSPLTLQTEPESVAKN